MQTEKSERWFCLQASLSAQCVQSQYVPCVHIHEITTTITIAAAMQQHKKRW